MARNFPPAKETVEKDGSLVSKVHVDTVITDPTDDDAVQVTVDESGRDDLGGAENDTPNEHFGDVDYGS